MRCNETREKWQAEAQEVALAEITDAHEHFFNCVIFERVLFSVSQRETNFSLSLLLKLFHYSTI